MKKKKRLSVVPPASALPGIDLFVFGDTHVNSRVGLLAPGCQDDEGAPIEPSVSQVWLWERWLDFASRASAARLSGRRVFVLGLGDLVDENTHDGFQLHEPFNYATMLRMAHATHKPLIDAAERVFLVRGTAAHTGGAGYLEELLAQSYGDKIVPDAERGTLTWWVLEAQLAGVNLLAQHHPGTNSMRPWTRGGAANRLASMVVTAYYGQAWAPKLALFGHIHHSEDSLDNHAVRAITNRAWKLADGYDHRGGRGYMAREVGGLIVHLDDGAYSVEKVAYTLPKPQPWRE